MTFPSSGVIHVSNHLIGPHPGQSLFPTPDVNPFRTLTPANPPALNAVKLSEKNLISVVMYLLKNGNDPIFLPTGRTALEAGEKRFNIGDTLVLEFKEERGLKWAVVRPPTDTEVNTYGLAQGSLYA